jgi:dolichyl-phosphate beta-glucosyltransferase
MPCDISVVIPAYNEAGRIEPGLRRAVDYLRGRGLSYEVLVVDDGSRDRTVEVASSFADEGVRVIRHEKNRGKGAAIRTGVLASRGDEVLLTDADFSTPIEELEKLEARLEKTPVVIGSRGLADSVIQEHQPFYRELMGKTFNRIIRILGVRGLRDTQCGFKLFHGAALRLFPLLQEDGFAFDVELLLLAQRRGLHIAEVPVNWTEVPGSKVHLLRDGARMLRAVRRIERRFLRGEYDDVAVLTPPFVEL